jgi:hypothetical protein
MLEVEARRLCRILLEQEQVSPLLNLGSSTRQFREIVQPHITRELFGPLERSGISIFHSDLKQADGVDLAGDILDPEVRRALAAGKFKSLLVANLLEHVRDRKAVAAACEEIVGPGGLILATVPSSYPFHADPIDTFYRPSPRQLAGLFARSEIVLAEELIGPSFAEVVRARGSSTAKELAKTLFGTLLLVVRPRSAAARLHRWRWYARPYRISIALVTVRHGLERSP